MVVDKWLMSMYLLICAYIDTEIYAFMYVQMLGHAAVYLVLTGGYFGPS